MDVLDLELEPTPRAVSEARHAVTTRFQELPEQQLEDLRLLITELVTNGVVHGGLEPDERLRVRVQADGDVIRAEVVDGGKDGQIAARPLDPESPGGFGLHLVQMLTDRWGVHQNGVTCVWFEMSAPEIAQAG